MSVQSILFLGKRNDLFAGEASDYLCTAFSDATIVLGTRDEELPQEAASWKGDCIISYLSPWIVPASLLERANLYALNFHPGPPEYPGIGCTNFALYDGVEDYGVTCHHMLEKVDTGDIVAVQKFPVIKTETVYSLTRKCYAYILSLFYEVIDMIVQGIELPVSPEIWKRTPYLRKELDALCELTSDMSKEEIVRRIKATSYPNMPGAYLKLHGFSFSYDERK